MNGLDLFSGIGGNSIALREWINTIAYCEADRHAQSVLLSRMERGDLKPAPVWGDITTLTGEHFNIPIDIITAGFPCQDISVAGRGEGLEGKRSGLFFEVVRLAEEIQPPFLFLENVPAIRTRGLETVVREFSNLGYDCRWCTVSAAQVGAPHKRERWFMLANSVRTGRDVTKIRQSTKQSDDRNSSGENGSTVAERRPKIVGSTSAPDTWRNTSKNWWSTEPNMGRVANGIPLRVDRIKRLGNAVVPLQAKVAFEYLLTSKISPKIDMDKE